MSNSKLDVVVDDEMMTHYSLSEFVALVQIVTYTSDLRGAGTDATVFVEVTGELGSSPRHSLIAPGSTSDSFGRGQTDSLTLELPELGVLQSLTIGRAALTAPLQGCFCN